MRSAETVEEDLTLCAARYALNGGSPNRFEQLVNCHKEVSDQIELGFTDECALLWAHYGASNFHLCAEACSAGFGSEEIDLTGDAPECALSECLKCSNDTFQAAFDSLSGRTMQGSGLTEAIARSCSEFTSVVHEPCGDFFCEMTAPTPAPTSGGFTLNMRLSLLAGLVTAGVFL